MKKTYLIILFILGFVSLHLNSSGQSKYLVMGNKAYENKQYVLAIDYFTKALSNFEGDLNQRNELALKQADCIRMINNPKKTEIYYQRLVKNKYAEQKPLVYLHLANALSSQGKYAEALPMFEQYLARVPGDVLALAGKTSCELSMQDTTADKRWSIRNIREINSFNDDFAPIYGDDQFKTVIFSSNRKGTTGKEMDNWTDGTFSDLFVATKKKGETFGVPVLADTRDMVNTQANEGAAFLGYGYKKLYFTRCSKMQKSMEYCQILEADRLGNGWGQSSVIYTDSLGNVGQPVLSADGLTMIFSSNRPGGSGGKDLWKATRSSDQKPFGPAVNLGSRINTPGDEMFPTLLADTVLYFASNGRTGFGGLDIYHTTLGINGFSEVKHLPRPVNSPSDDFAMSFEENKEKGIYTSRRTGGKGGDDIYSFEKINWKVTIKGSVRDEITQKPIKSLPVYMFDDRNDTIVATTDNMGGFLFGSGQVKEEKHYTLVFSEDNYFTKKANVVIGTLKRDSTCLVNIVLQPIPDKPIVLPDIYYELNKWDLLPQYEDSLMVLVKVLNDNPKIVIELASHTDSRASDQYNDELSQKRAETAVRFITGQGINKDRLVAKGYGKRMPRVLATDIIRDGYTFERGKKLTEAYVLSIPDLKKREVAYQLNRRTEFSVIGKNFK